MNGIDIPTLFKLAIIFPAVIVTLLLLLKLVEMVINIHWVYRVHADHVKSIQISVKDHSPYKLNKLLHEYNFPFFPGNTRLTQWMKPARDHHKQSLKQLIRRAFRYPYLMICCSILIILINQGKDLGAFQSISQIILSILIFIGIWIKAVHLLIYRYRFGVVDNFLLSLSVPIMAEKIANSFSRREALQRFIRIMISSLTTFLIGYAAIYYVIGKEIINGNSLEGIDPQAPLCIQTFYFSTATLLTVGFGDINAKGACALLVVTSEMLLGLLLLIIFVTAFSATIPTED